ncbi:hypothetical protein V1514DRAFT_337090 [Lipomyces japonicus]|uniref:uncharacterized protein n=1 Tax=Lipomyces japonicus TaxID=56871 RepID=UPI0034CD9905
MNEKEERLSSLQNQVDDASRQQQQQQQGDDVEDGTLHQRLLGPSIQKSGQDGVDQVAVGEIIFKASEGSRYFDHQKRKEIELTKKIDVMIWQAHSVSRQDIDAAEIRASAVLAQLETTRDLTQSIVHVDCDAFYASVEELDHPELKSKPFAVGKGVLCTCNYEARKFGIRSAMAEFVAKKICPELIIYPLNFDKYIAKANQVRNILKDYDEKFCATTLDEAYLNITKYATRVSQDREQVVNEMRTRVKNETGLTISAGIGPNSRIAKIASNINKPNGQFNVSNDRESVLDFMSSLAVRKLTGVGYVLERQLNALGIVNCEHIYLKRALISELFTDSTSNFLFDCYLGLGSTVVRPIEEFERKSIGSETTFRASSDPVMLRHKLRHACDELEKDCRRLNMAGRKIGLKIKRETFEMITRSRPVGKPVCKSADFYKLAVGMLEKELPISARLIGVRVTDLVDLSHEGPMKSFLRGQSRMRLGSGKPTILDMQQDIEAENEEAVEMDMIMTGSQPDVTDLAEIERDEKIEETVEINTQGEEKEKEKDENNKNNNGNNGNDDDNDCLEKIACPVCGNLVTVRNDALNAHIDWCLSRGAIKEAVRSTFR